MEFRQYSTQQNDKIFSTTSLKSNAIYSSSRKNWFKIYILSKQSNTEGYVPNTKTICSNIQTAINSMEIYRTHDNKS